MHCVVNCYTRKKPFTGCAKMLNHVASIVAIFQLLQTNWIRVGRARHSNSDYNPNRSLHLAYAYNSRYCYCDKLQKTRTKGRWNENTREKEKEKERERENMWNSNVGKRMDYENPRVLPARVLESNYGLSGSIAAKNHGRKRDRLKRQKRPICRDYRAREWRNPNQNPIAGHVYEI